MIDIEDKTRQPDMEEIRTLIDNRLFDELCRTMEGDYHARQRIEYSGDRVLLGWNVKFQKAGRTLCTVYPRKRTFPLLLVVGRKEKERVERLLPSLSDTFQQTYRDTAEGMGQRWMLFSIDVDRAVLDDILKVVRIRRESR